LRSAVEGSLRRLQKDRLDLLYLHRIDATIPIEDTIGALSNLVAEGKARCIGVPVAHCFNKTGAG
jgi:aryl-alcohol dehydrogenase-like predicted oxidoreductase